MIVLGQVQTVYQHHEDLAVMSVTHSYNNIAAAVTSFKLVLHARAIRQRTLQADSGNYKYVQTNAECSMDSMQMQEWTVQSMTIYSTTT
jgi:hypothetical protein